MTVNPVAAMFGRIANVYDRLNHILSFGIDRGWRKELTELAPDGALLDLACGTMDVAMNLARTKPGATVLAMDFCPPMIARGLDKLKKEGLDQSVAVAAADALNLPLPDNCLDGITMAFGIRNIQQRVPAFCEMLRTLRPGGRACILEFGSASERIWGGAYNFYLAVVLPAIGRLIARDKNAYSYLARTIRQFPDAPTLAAEMTRAGFVNARFRKLTGGIVCLHWGEKPEKAA